MVKTSRCFSVLIFFGFLFVIQPTTAAVKGEVTEFGYYKMTADPKRYRNIASTSGYVKEGGDVELVESTEHIPLTKGRLFGFKFRISGFENKRSVQLNLIVKHPEITRPNGSTSTGYSYPVAFDVIDGVIENESGYSIDHDYEMVEGEWSFEYWYYKQKLVTKTFTTYFDNEVENEERAEPGTADSGTTDPGTADHSTEAKPADAVDSGYKETQQQSGIPGQDNS